MKASHSLKVICDVPVLIVIVYQVSFQLQCSHVCACVRACVCLCLCEAGVTQPTFQTFCSAGLLHRPC